jgi:hypothetical protein
MRYFRIKVTDTKIKENAREKPNDSPTYTLNSSKAIGPIPARFVYVQSGSNVILSYSYQVRLPNAWYDAQVDVKDKKTVVNLIDWASDNSLDMESTSSGSDPSSTVVETSTATPTTDIGTSSTIATTITDNPAPTTTFTSEVPTSSTLGSETSTTSTLSTNFPDTTTLTTTSTDLASTSPVPTSTSASTASSTPITTTTSTLPPIPTAIAGSYNVLPLGVNDPRNATVRIVYAQDSYNKNASPYGWHDEANGKNYTDTRGNNVYVQVNKDGTRPWEAKPRPRSGAGLEFNHTSDFSLEPANYSEASAVQLFYSNNMIHDLLYAYGFDEQSGNFQANNFNKGGEGNDGVIANTQDGSGTNNANFMTPPDGSKYVPKFGVRNLQSKDGILISLST